jgi:hypothetical protein
LSLYSMLILTICFIGEENETKFNNVKQILFNNLMLDALPL